MSIFTEALKLALGKRPMPTTLGSLELSRLDAAVKRRAVFSARLDRATVLQQFRKDLALIVSGGVDEHGRLRSIPEAKAQLREAMARAGVPAAEEGTPELRDFYSDARRQLMVETNVLDTLNYGRTILETNSTALGMFPCWELVRRIQPKGCGRDWEQRWADAGGEFYEGRMIARKDDPVWQNLGDGAGGYEDTLGNPWPPFAFNSGMRREEIARADCIRLGVMDEGDKVRPAGLPGLNDNLEFSLDRFDDDMAAALRESLAADGFIIDGGVLRLANSGRALWNSRVYERDDLGRFAPDGQGTLSPHDNIRRGSKAVERALRRQGDVPRAMQVAGLGDVDLVWGRPGTEKKDANGASHYDGYGISHIRAKRGDKAVRMLPRVLAHGKVQSQGENPDKKLIKWKNWTAVVEKTGKGKSYVLTNIDDDTKPKGGKKLSRLHNSSSGFRTKVRTGLDFPCSTHTTLTRATGGMGASNTVTIPQMKRRIKTILLALQVRERIRSLNTSNLTLKTAGGPRAS